MILENGLINSRNNNLNLIRLLAATSVTFAHCFAMTHGSPYVLGFGINSASFGFYAVAIFFGLSGFLIAQSYFRNPDWFIFLKARLLRLVPGYLFSNVISLFIIICLVKNDFSLFFTQETVLYFLSGSFLAKFSYPDVYKHLHYNSTNGSAWTLPYEFLMYLMVLILGLIGFLKNKILFFSLFILFLAFAFFRNMDATYLSLPLCFGLGVSAFLLKDKFKVFLIPAAVVLIASLFTDLWLFKILAWIYFIFSFAYTPKIYMPKLNFKNDISYGIYILSWPVQQLILHYQLTNHPLIMFVYSMAIIIPLSLVSWIYIEKPSLKFKSQTVKN
jgi:peptidoglycan/LPS O-acetylase OafA/YrhL